MNHCHPRRLRLLGMTNRAGRELTDGLWEFVGWVDVLSRMSDQGVNLGWSLYFRGIGRDHIRPTMKDTRRPPKPKNPSYVYTFTKSVKRNPVPLLLTRDDRGRRLKYLSNCYLRSHVRRTNGDRIHIFDAFRTGTRTRVVITLVMIV